MKSVVVEASTVAKAIETAWHKAEKPEEFFVRVLQEHQSGFLGFGSQKAKIVLFFKNSQKSDSLFPVILKQKEYANLFGNNHLKIPTQLGVIDAELNKNIPIGTAQKKKNHQQNQPQKNKKTQDVNIHQSSASHNPHLHKAQQPKVQHQEKSSEQKPLHKVTHHKPKENLISEIKVQNKPIKNPENKVVAVKKDIVYKQPLQEVKPVEHKPKLQVTLQAPIQEPEYKKIIDSFDAKDDMVKNIAQTLKKVQSQKIVAHVSRQVSEKIEHLKTKTADVAIDQKIVAVPVNTKIEKTQEVIKTSNLNDVKQEIRFKRRPLIIDESVSGIRPLTPKSEKQISGEIDNVDKID